MPQETITNDPMSHLLSLGTPRVWSMLVTIFGDLAQGPQDRIVGPVLSNLTEHMQLKPEAVRVALHRLRLDDWISSQKTGRLASYGLTQNGRAQSRAVSPVIYSRPAEMPQGWHMVLTSSNEAGQKDQLIKAGFTQLLPRVFFGADTLPLPSFAMPIAGTDAPVWLSQQLQNDASTDEFSNLLTVLARTQTSLGQKPSLDPVQTAVMRCLIVHHWRRLALRFPYLPPALTGPDWPGHGCRAAVTQLLDALPRPSLMDLSVK